MWTISKVCWICYSIVTNSVLHFGFWPQGTWDLSSPNGIEPTTPALEGEVSTTGQPGQSLWVTFKQQMFISYSSSGWKSKIRVPALLGEGCRLLVISLHGGRGEGVLRLLLIRALIPEGCLHVPRQNSNVSLCLGNQWIFLVSGPDKRISTPTWVILSISRNQNYLAKLIQSFPCCNKGMLSSLH